MIILKLVLQSIQTNERFTDIYIHTHTHFFLIEIYLIYNTVLVSGVQHSDSDIFFFRFFSPL